jgi:hypothetical protein
MNADRSKHSCSRESATSPLLTLHGSILSSLNRTTDHGHKHHRPTPDISKAATYSGRGGYNVIAIGERSVRRPASGEVRIKVADAAVDPTDMLLRRPGAYRFLMESKMQIRGSGTQASGKGLVE